MRLPIAFVLSGLVASALAASADDFDTLRLRWKTMLTGGPNLDLANPDIAIALSGISSSAESWWATLNKAPNRTALWSDAANMANTSAHITITYQRLRAMALGYATRGTSVEGNAVLRADLISALDWMNANRYNKSKSIYDNWWDWQIGSPLALNDLTVLLYDDLSATQIANYMSAVDKFTPKPDRTAANRVWLSSVVVVRGVIVKSSSKITSGRDGFTPVFSDVTSGDGFYADGSFVQHETLAYTGGYGASLLMNLVPVMDLLNGSTWQVTDAKRTNVFRWIHKSYQPFIYNGAMMDMVRGREISREAQWLADNVGSQVIASILRCAQFAPPADAAAFKSMAKYWIQADPSRAFVRNAPVSALALALEVLNDPYVESRGELIGNFQFPRGDRVVHSRPGFAFGLSMSSSRIANFECLNNENMRGWFTGEGMTYLYNGDAAQFGDNFWPTVNSYRLPGTTVDVRTRANGSGEEYRGAYTWVGGASLRASGVAGMQLDAWSSTLTAKKSWFMFDDEIVALGAGITSSDKRTIETVVENRKLADAGDNAFLVNDGAKPATLPWSETMTGVSWAHLAGNVPGADIGYYFPQTTTLKGRREARTNSWFEINAKRGSTNRYTRNYLSFWFDHGSNPANATYSYVLLPNKTADEVGIYASAPDIIILENTARAQAVRENNLNITAVNFWNDGTATVGGVTVDKKAAVMTQATDSELEVAVADPTQKNSSSIKVEIAMAAAATLSVEPGVTVTALSPKVKLTVNVQSAGGRTFHARFQLPPPPVDVAIVPIVTIAAADSSTAEAGADPGRFTITRSEPTNLPLQVFYGVGGTASNGVDYTMLSGSATIPAGFFTADVIVMPVNDAIFEGDETVIATLLPNATYALGASNSATVAIHDDEPVLTVTATNPNAAEQGTVPGRFVIVRSGSTAAPLTVPFTVGGTASSPSDYASLGTAVTLAAGASSINLDVLPVNDGVSEGAETVILALTPNPAFQIAGTGSATVTIADADASLFPTPLVELNLNEGSGTTTANAGALGGNFTLTAPRPAWTANVPPGVGGASAIDYGTTIGDFGLDSPGAMPGLRNLSKFTITGWINNRSTTQGSGGNRVLRNFVSGGHGIDLVYRSDGSLDLGVNAFPSSVARSSAGRITTSSTADTANWRFFAVTYDSSLGANHVQFFFGDAVNDAALDVVRTYARGPIGSNIGALTVGHVNPEARSGSTDRIFRGLIDNVCLFDAALTQSDLVAVQRSVKPPGVVPASILAKDILPEQSREPNSKAILGDTTSSPELSIGPGLVWRRTDSETLVFSWPAAYTGYRLQSRTNIADLSLDTEWVDVPDGSIIPVTVPILKTSPGAFFRLKSP